MENAGGEATMANVAPYITSKLSRFLSDINLRNTTCQSEMINFDTLVKHQRVLLFNLGKGRVGEDAAGLLAHQVVSRLWLAAVKRGTNPARQKPFFIYIDEFQLLADDRFAELLAESRKFGLALTIAHQFARQLPQSVLQAVIGNVGTSIAFRVGAEDAKDFEGLYAPHFTASDLVSQANFRAYVRSFGRLGSTPFSIEIGPVRNGDTRWAKELRHEARMRHGRPREEVEREIQAVFERFRRSEGRGT
jgi:hypothetical protein